LLEKKKKKKTEEEGLFGWARGARLTKFLGKQHLLLLLN
jgi:hypothetical protein